jgi:hypothetical protein
MLSGRAEGEIAIMERFEKRLGAFRLHALVAIVALALEFLLGMYTALFVAFPESLAEGNAWAWSMTNSAVTVAHVILGTVLIIVSISALGFGIAARNRAAIATSALGLVTVGLAYFSGTIFLSDIGKDAYSFAMACGFMGAMIAYGLAIYLTRPSR